MSKNLINRSSTSCRRNIVVDAVDYVLNVGTLTFELISGCFYAVLAHAPLGRDRQMKVMKGSTCTTTLAPSGEGSYMLCESY